MKKIMSILLVIFAACGKSDRQESPNDSWQMKEQTEKQTVEESETNENGSKQTEQDGEKKILVAYFSWADNAVQDDIDAMTSPSVKVPGDVAQLASWIGEETGGDRMTSALISFLRILAFQAGAVLILPVFFQIDRIWFSVVAAEMVAAVMTLLFIRAKRRNIIIDSQYIHLDFLYGSSFLV